MGHVPDSNLRDTLTANGWLIDFLGPTSYLGNTVGFRTGDDAFPKEMASWGHLPLAGECRPKRWNRCGR